MSNNQIAMLYVTYPNREEAEKTGQVMIKEGLAACMNTIPVTSCYIWQGAFEKEAEIVGIFKTRPGLVQSFREKIAHLHSYEVPCIIHWLVQVNESYAKWVHSNTKA